MDRDNHSIMMAQQQQQMVEEQQIQSYNLDALTANLNQALSG